jgi:NAD(P)H-dependent glutamate synthase small subunit
MNLEGAANDYLGKGMSGGRIVLFPPKNSKFQPHNNVIAGNTVLYGATGGEIYINGTAGERFCVRNSGAVAVVEGLGDHGCEYMTGGVVAVLGETGNNFAAGMSGGIAYVYDESEVFDTRCNLDMVDIESVIDKNDERFLHNLINNHYTYTKSPVARKILDNWQSSLPLFAKVMPIEYRLSLERIQNQEDPDKATLSVTEEVFLPSYMEHKRKDPSKRSVKERIRDYNEIEMLLPEDEIKLQASRCRDCGIPYCHAFGCPVSNKIPDWNLLVTGKAWEQALENLHSSNNFPEITGRICPAPCEAACTLAINMPPVSIKHIELQIAEMGWKNGWIQPKPSPVRTGRKVAVIGSGPAGLAAAQQLARSGHEVTVYEKESRIGGLLRYGIPDFKLEKHIIDRRIEQMKAEGVVFETNVNAGIDISTGYLKRSFDAMIIAAGARIPRDIDAAGRGLNGIHFAMDFLRQQNKINAGDKIPKRGMISAEGKNVLVIGGGDTGSDCVGTSHRQGAKKIYQVEILPKPPEYRAKDNPWPSWPLILRTTSSHEEGCERMWSMLTKEFIGSNGVLSSVKLVEIEWSRENGRHVFKEIPGSEFELKAELVLLSMGFLHIEHSRIVTELDLATDGRGNLIVDEHLMTSDTGVFAAGDSVMGASLVVRAIDQGRKAAEAVD